MHISYLVDEYLQVINETIRLANIVPGIFRKTLQDVKYGGMSFPHYISNASKI